MQGVHAFDPKAKTSIDLESFVAEDHFLRRIDRVLDLSFIRELTAARYADGQGRPSIDPEVYFRMQLVAYFNGITTDRRLCEEVHDNLAYRWFCRRSLADEVPDHSSLTRIRDRLGEEVFESVFRRIVEQCQQKGLVKSRLSRDDRRDSGCGRRFAQLAGSQRSRKGKRKRRHEARGMVGGSHEHTASDPIKRTAAAPIQTRRWLKRGEPLGNSNTKSIRRSMPTVGSSWILKSRREPDTTTNLIWSRSSGSRDRYKITIDEATADRGYGSAEIIQSLKETGNQALHPALESNCVGRNSGECRWTELRTRHDRIRCAAGKYLYPNAGRLLEPKTVLHSPGECRDCPVASSCSNEEAQSSLYTIRAPAKGSGPVR